MLWTSACNFTFCLLCCFFFFQAEDGIRDDLVTGVQTCALPIWRVGLRLRVRAASRSQAANREPPPQAARRGRSPGTREARNVRVLPPQARLARAGWRAPNG